MRITTVRDKRVKAMVEDATLTTIRGFDAVEFTKVRQMLDALIAMTDPAELYAVPSWRFHQLKGNRRGTWSLTVTANQRLTFRIDVERQEVSVLDYEDYH